MSTDHLEPSHICRIIPMTQIFFSFPVSLYHILPLTNISTLILIPLPLQNPLYSGCLFLVISSIMPKNSWKSSIDWSIKLLPLNSFSYSSEETNFKMLKIGEGFKEGGKKTNPPNTTKQYPTVPKTSQGSRVKFQTFVEPPNNFTPGNYINICLLLSWWSSPSAWALFLVALGSH